MASRQALNGCAFLCILQLYINLLILASSENLYTEAKMAIKKPIEIPNICTQEKDSWTINDNYPHEQARTKRYMGIGTENYEEYIKSPSVQDARLQPFAAKNLTLNLYSFLNAYNISGYRLNIFWTTPHNVIGLRGFLVNVTSYTTGIKTGVLQTLYVLRLYNLYNGTNYQPNQLMNSECLAMGSVRKGTVITISSLPRTSNNYVQAHMHYVNVGTQEWKNFNADNWQTLMFAIIYPQSSVVRIQFVSASAHVGFVQYTVCLKSKSSHFYNYNQSTIVHLDEEEVTLELRSVLPGVYDILLLPSRVKQSRNMCEESDLPNSRLRIAAEVHNVVMVKCEGIGSQCSPLRKVVEYEWTFEASQTTSAHVSSIGPLFGASVENPSEPSLKYVITCIATLVILAVAVVTFVVINRKVMSRKATALQSAASVSTVSETKQDSNGDEDKLIVRVEGISSQQMDTIAIIKSARRVLIVYSSDNDYHLQVVEKFAFFLQRHCMCDVILDMWSEDEISQISPIDWVYSRVLTVDTILVIHSEGGTRKYHAMLEGSTYEKRIQDSCHLQDTFIVAFKFIINKQQSSVCKSLRIFNLRFSYSKRNMQIMAGIQGHIYEMMRNIEELFLLIHGLSRSSRDGRSNVCIINHEEYASVPEGKALQDAIRKAEIYHRNYPEWFDRIYNKVIFRDSLPDDPRAIDSTVASPSRASYPIPNTVVDPRTVENSRNNRADEDRDQEYNDSGLDSGVTRVLDGRLDDDISEQHSTTGSADYVLERGWSRRCPRNIKAASMAYVEGCESECEWRWKPPNPMSDTSSMNSEVFGGFAYHMNEIADAEYHIAEYAYDIQKLNEYADDL